MLAAKDADPSNPSAPAATEPASQAGIVAAELVGGPKAPGQGQPEGDWDPSASRWQTRSWQSGSNIGDNFWSYGTQDREAAASRQLLRLARSWPQVDAARS